MAADTLCIGDLVCLYSEEVFGFSYALQSSCIHSSVAVHARQDRVKPDIPDAQVISFEICVANRFKLSKKYRKLKSRSDANPDDLFLKTQVSAAEIGGQAENEDNVAEQNRQRGKKLLYGQVIQLRHEFTGKYIHVSTTQTSATESSNMQVELCDHNAKQAQFKIMPRYKVKSEGDVVQVEDQIVLESVKSPGQYLHVSKGYFPSHSVYNQSHEMNLSVRQSGFTIYRRYKPEDEHENLLKAGVPIRLFHKEIEAYLCAEGLYDDQVTEDDFDSWLQKAKHTVEDMCEMGIYEDVHLRVRQVDQNNPKSLFPSSSAITYWQVELEEGIINGGVVRWEQQCRIRHMTTRKYLKIEGQKQVTLTESYNDPRTVFRLHPVIKERDQVAYETYCRIEHVVTRTWLHAQDAEYLRKHDTPKEVGDMSMAGLQWTTATLKQITVSEDMQYDDAFTLQWVDPEFVTNFNFMAGMVPFIQKLIAHKKAGSALNAKYTHDIVCALSEMKSFMIVNSVPNKMRQKLFRNLRIVELLVQLLRLPYRGSPDQRHLVQVFVEAYDVLYTYLKGDSRKNELYIAKHIDFFESQISYEGDIGLNAAHMVMELVKDNRKIVDRITKKHIDGFVSLLRRNKNYRYLDLLSVLCVCDGVSIPDNQKYITEVWLKQGQMNSVYHTDLGQKIGKDSNVVYVSKNNQRTWMALHDFVQEKNLQEDEEFLFLEHQLELFGQLCYGRNTMAIDVITQELCYLTWEEAFLCLTNEQLPDQLRAKYCHLIIGLFVDVGENTSLLDRINLTFVYDDIKEVGKQGTADEADQKLTTDRSTTTKYFPLLRDWISRFLDNNKDMTASLIGHNMLVEQVLRLVHYLVKYGYYGHTDDIKSLLGPLLSLLDGRNDKPYPRGVQVTPDVLKRYRTEGRYKQSPETKAIVDAKHQAMEVLDLFFNFRFNTRLEQFSAMFKQVHSSANAQASSGLAELVPLLHETYDIYDNPGTNATANRKLEEMFSESAYFRGFNLVDILLDLSHYEYDKMVVGSMALLNRFYSAHDTLFSRAVQAQVLVTDQSIEVLHELEDILPVMRRLTTAKMTEAQTRTMSNILDKLIGFCSLENEPEERHPMNQSILYNHGIMADIFDILSQDFDIRLIDQYRGLRNIFEKSFKLLQVMARGNEIVQQRLFDRLDMLLEIQGAESQMALALTEVFTGNKDTCMKILPHQVQKIMTLVSQHTNLAPQFLDLLNAVVKVEELNLPLKRNQGYVMKYFMQYRSEVAYVIDQGADFRQKLLMGKDCADLQFLIALVDLLATCAEGENRFIESICQTIFSVDELLDVMTNSSIDNNLKRPYLRFLLWVYLNTAGGMIESGSGDLPHDGRVWTYLLSLVQDLASLTAYAQKSGNMVKQLMKKAPGKSGTTDLVIPLDDPEKLNNFMSEFGQEDWQKHHGSLHYFFDGVMPFMQVFFRTYYHPDRESYPDEADHVDKLAAAMMSFTQAVGPLVSDESRMKTLVASMTTLLSASTLPVKVMEEFQQNYGGGVTKQDIRSDARKKYEDYYAMEEELNVQLNVYAVNYSAIYGGFNDVKTQIGFPSDNDYTEMCGDEELPLGQEFQEHISCFIIESAHTAAERYTLASKLVEQLFISASNSQLGEQQRLQQEQLDIKCLQLLRGLIHNEVVKLPDDWELDIKINRKERKKQLKKVESVQNSLNAYDTVLKVLPHLSKTRDDIVREVLALLAAMLFGGNEAVQGNLIEYFLGTREEKFFFAVKNRMELSAVATKEKRSLMAQHQAKLEEAVTQAKALRKAMKTGQMAAAEIMAANNMGSTLLGHSQTRLGSRSAIKGNKKGKTSSSLVLKSRYGSQLALGSKSSLKRSTLQLPVISREQSQGIELTPVKREDKVPLIVRDNQVAPAVDAGIELKVEDAEELELQAAAADMLQEMEGDMDYKDDGYIELVLKILGLMCDGQNKTLQDYLREQPDNIKSVNLVAETARFLSLVYGSINTNTIALVTELFNTLVEFTSGNMQNQTTVFDNKICDYINFILRGAQFQGCSYKEVLQLKKSIITLIISMIEENPKKSKDFTSGEEKHVGTAKEVTDSLDAESIYQVMMDCYRRAVILGGSQKRLDLEPWLQSEYEQDSTLKSRTKQTVDLREATLDVGFGYYHVLCRMIDLDQGSRIRRSKLIKSNEEEMAWNFYSNGTLSIEIFKNEALQKIYFRVKDKGVLREDVKEKFKYQVDRSSPSNKLREFMDWSTDIMQDIKYTQKVLANPISRFFVKFWWYFNILMMTVSFAFFFLVMITWMAPLNTVYSNSTFPAYIKPRYRFDGVEVTTYVLGGLHNLLAVCVLLSYFISNHPSLPRSKSIVNFFRRWRPRPTGFEDEDSDEEEERESNLEVKFFSIKTFWYLLLFVFSVLGTLSYGYCFAFHLLHMAEFNQLLARAIQAVRKNGRSLMWVFFYGLIFIYIYSLVSFAFYRGIYDAAEGEYCTQMYECFVTILHRGFIVSMFEFLTVPNGLPFSYHLHKAVFDFTFFIIITTIGLNIIFGIIVDTFSELRDNKWQVDNDMHTTCFICSRSSYEFEHQGGGFEQHVKHEHNQWAYLFFFIHLDETRPNDYTAVELFVSRLLGAKKYDFFPLNRALSLEHEEDSNEIRLETMMQQVAYLVTKMKQEESRKEREEEQKRQREWEQRHKGEKAGK